MKRWLGGCLLAACGWMSSGCSSLVSEGASAGAGILGGSIASAVTDSAGVAAGIGIGVQAAARAGVQYEQRKIHGEAQQQIAQVAGPLKVGQVKGWKTVPSLPLEPEEAGRVTVSRVIASLVGGMQGSGLLGEGRGRDEGRPAAAAFRDDGVPGPRRMEMGDGGTRGGTLGRIAIERSGR